MQIPLFVKALPLHGLLASFFILPLWQQQAAITRAEAVTQADIKNISYQQSLASKDIMGKPSRIILPRQGIDLNIVEGKFDNHSAVWTVANRSANHAVNTVKPNNKSGKTLIYGHWTADVFGPTKNLKPGDRAIVYAGPHVFIYSYESKMTVSPKDTSLFSSLQGEPGLIIITCEGAFAQERRIMYFTLHASR